MLFGEKFDACPAPPRRAALEIQTEGEDMKTSMGKRLGSLLLTLVFLLGMLPAMEQSARAAITDWAELQTALSAGGTVTLTQNLTAAETGPLTVASGVTVTLDLNGHIIDRGLTAATVCGYVISVSGSLTIRDGAPTATHAGDYGSLPAGGVITGGCNTDNSSNGNNDGKGGGVYVDGGGSLTLESGSIAVNKANKGGGVFVGSGSTFTMNGGTISGCSAVNGGGVYVDDGGTFTMTGGIISGNVGLGGGAYLNNFAGSSPAAFNVSGDVTITGNTGIGNNSDKANNVHLYAGTTITAVGTLGSDASIGVSTGTVPTDAAPVTVAAASGHTLTESDAAKFFGDSGKAVVLDSGALKLVNKTPWAALNDKLAAGGTVTLYKDYTAASTDGALSVPAGKSVTLDLNGHILDRGLQNGDGYNYDVPGSVIQVAGTLTLMDGDSDSEHTGLSITNPVTNSAAVVTGGVITGGSRSSASDSASVGGGGIDVVAGGTCTMNGGSVVGNVTFGYGGGVCLSGTGSRFVMNGGQICYNTTNSNGAGEYGSGVCVYAGTFTMTDGTIAGNYSGNYGGGVYVYSDATFVMSGGAITENQSRDEGGGVYVSGEYDGNGNYTGGYFKVSDNPQIMDNLQAQQSNNVHLEYASITVIGALDDAYIGVTYADPSESDAAIAQGGAPASGGSAYTLTADDAEKFSYDSDSFAVSLDSTNNKLVLTAASSSSITTWAELQTALSAGGTVTLTQDVTAAADDSPLAITSGVTATLDLNGKTLTANNTMSASTSLGSSNMAILVQSGGALTVKDTGTGGKINGNGTTYGVYLNDGTATACPSFTLEGGTISGCSSYGVKIMGGNNSSYQPTFTMTGGTISGNTRGGVSTSAAAYSLFNMSGGTITGNGGAAGSSTYNYGGVYISGGTFTMSGGSITANGGTYGGVCLYADIGTCVLNMSGGSITNNTGSIGGGVYVNRNTSNAYPYTAQFKLSGNPTISGNTANGAANNVCLIKGGDAQTVVTVTGALTNTTPIGVTLGTGYSGAFTSGLSGKGAAANFTSDDETKHVALNASSEAILASGGAITSWSALQTALNAGGTVTLTQNVTASSTDSALTIGSGVTVTLDLKGFTVDRGLTSESPVDNGGYVIRVDGGSLTLKDTSSGHTGTITGGSNSNNSSAKLGGGVSVYGGTFVMDGGIITGNHGQVSGGGGVYVIGSYSSSAAFTMNGGEIKANTSQGVGGVIVQDHATFTMNGGKIIGNSGGGVSVSADSNTNSSYNPNPAGGKFIMTGGEISGHTGGGVGMTYYSGPAAAHAASFAMSGGSITGNSGGGVNTGFGFASVSGNAVITGNTASDGTTSQNMYIPSSGNPVTVTGALGSSASIGIAKENATEGAVVVQGAAATENTSAYTLTDADAAKFSYDGGAFEIARDSANNTLFADALHYALTISADIQNGAVTAAVGGAAAAKAKAGDAVVLTPAPATGYELDTLSYTPTGGAATAVTETNGAYSFTMPAAAVTVGATFSPIRYEITYDLAGGALANGSENPEAYTITSAAITLNNPTKTGFVFAGWTGTDLMAATMTVTIPAGSTGARSYTATWTQNAPVDSIDWSLENHVLTITGSGAMPDYTKSAAPWFARRAEIQSVVFRSTAAPITHIGNYAFYACGAIRSVSVDSVGMSVGDYAFAYCAALQSVVNADGGGARFGDVSRRAFYACFSLSTANRPAVQGAQGDGAFDLCGLN